MAWIESHEELAQHPKTKRLSRALGLSIPAVLGHLHLLWWWALKFAQDGDLGRYRPEDIAEGLLWEGDPQALVDGLVEAGFLELGEGGLRIHDWDEYAGRLIQRRRANADRMRRQRKGEPEPAPARRAAHVQDTLPARAGLPEPNRTQPNTTQPDLSSPTPPGPEGGAGGTAAAAAVCIGQLEFSEDAGAVLETWREAHGRERVPKLNPTQAAKLEAAIGELGRERLLEACVWSAERGIAEFDKAVRAAYSKRLLDEGRAPVGAGRVNGTKGGAGGQRAVRGTSQRHHL